MPQFHHLSFWNQNQSTSNLVICNQNTKAIALHFGQNASLSSLFNLQSKSINFKFGHVLPSYQGYSPTFWPKMPHFHHFSICNQNRSISNLVSFHQNTKPIALLFGQNAALSSLSSLFNLESKSINFKFGHFSPKYQGYSLSCWPNWLIVITCQSGIEGNECHSRHCQAC